MNRPRNIYLLVPPRVHLLDLAAPGQVFAHDAFAEQLNLHYISPNSELKAYQGLCLTQLEPLPQEIHPDDWLMLIGSYQLHRYIDEPAYQQVITWLQGMHSHFGLIAGICSGTLLAAKAGILGGKRCTTHHNLMAKLREMATTALVQEDCIFVSDDKLWTSAGITTGMDLCLHLVAEYWGQERATLLARDMVLYQRRSGHEAQLSFWLQHRNHMQSRIHKVQDMVMESPGYSWTIKELATQVHLSERHLRRLFQSATSTRLQDYLQQAKLELARRLLEQTRLALGDIAERCGFSAERSLRRTWARWLEGTPASYRRQLQFAPDNTPTSATHNGQEPSQ